MPKPRGLNLSEADLHKSSRFQRRAAAKQTRVEEQAAEKLRRSEAKEKDSGKKKKSKSQSAGAGGGGVPEAKSGAASPVDEGTAKVEGAPLAFGGEEVQPDFEVGLRNERVVVEQECMWAEPITRELQVSFPYMHPLGRRCCLLVCLLVLPVGTACQRCLPVYRLPVPPVSAGVHRFSFLSGLKVFIIIAEWRQYYLLYGWELTDLTAIY